MILPDGTGSISGHTGSILTAPRVVGTLEAVPHILDNITQHLRSALAETMFVAPRADFCVGYFNLLGKGSSAPC